MLKRHRELGHILVFGLRTFALVDLLLFRPVTAAYSWLYQMLLWAFHAPQASMRKLLGRDLILRHD